ncbi:MAG: antitoxin Xre/MbcA/ParS toxin-binding domain-containing protein [Actinomycetota bacterium]
MTTHVVSRQQAKNAKTVSRSSRSGRFVSASSQKQSAATTVESGSASVEPGALPQSAVRAGFLIETLGSGAEVARLLGVNRSQPSQWRSGKEAPSASTARQLLDLDYVMAKALQIWPAKAALDWFHGPNDHLDGARPIDVLKLRGTAEVIQALEAEMA